MGEGSCHDGRGAPEHSKLCVTHEPQKAFFVVDLPRGFLLPTPTTKNSYRATLGIPSKKMQKLRLWRSQLHSLGWEGAFAVAASVVYMFSMDILENLKDPWKAIRNTIFVFASFEEWRFCFWCLVTLEMELEFVTLLMQLWPRFSNGPCWPHP